jgi:G3E family GTPase
MENNIKPHLYLINGPLGAGKTTFLKKLLALPEYQDARVIENEFASTSVDTEQLHSHHAEVKTIAGVCICCSTGDELTDALRSLAKSAQPVIIEATGVANSLKLIEKIVVADMLDLYTVKHAVFILDAVEAMTNLDATINMYRNELKAADTVLVSKIDLLSRDNIVLLMDTLHKIKLSQVSFVHNGDFNEALLRSESHILDYFMHLEENIQNHDDNSNFTIVDSSELFIDIDTIDIFWKQLCAGYGIRRLKGNIKDIKGTSWHIEATPGQCKITSYRSGVYQIVLIGTDAKSVNRTTLEGMLRGDR